jgi:hypothetical protein
VIEDRGQSIARLRNTLGDCPQPPDLTACEVELIQCLPVRPAGEMLCAVGDGLPSEKGPLRSRNGPPFTLLKSLEWL